MTLTSEVQGIQKKHTAVWYMHHYGMTSGKNKRWYHWMQECQECAPKCKIGIQHEATAKWGHSSHSGGRACGYNMVHAHTQWMSPWTSLHNVFHHCILQNQLLEWFGCGCSWPPCLPDTDPCNYLLMGYIKDCV